MITYGSTTLTSYNSIVRTEVYYYKSTSATSLSGGSWATTKPTWENGKYIWQKIRTVYEDGTHTESDPVNITGQQGTTGTAAYSYKLNSSDSIIGKTKDGEYTIKKITFSATYKQGTGAVSAYGGRFKIESTTNGSTWKTEYTSSGNEASKEFIIPDDIIAIKCALYQSDGTTVLLDIVTVPVVKDGVDAIGLRDSIPYYLASDKDTGITRLTQGWTRYRPQLTAEKKYLWVYYVSRYSEGTTEPELIEIKDDLVHFINNGEESPVESCVVDIEPVQDLNRYDHPWAGGTGKNLFDMNSAVDGFIAGTGTTISSPDINNMTSDFIPVVAGQTYTYNCIPTSTDNPWTGWAFYSAKDMSTVINGRIVVYAVSATFTVPDGANYLRIGSRNLKNGKAQVEKGSVATEWKPYENICPITGWTGAKVTRTGKNLLNPTLASGTNAGLTATKQSDGSYRVIGTANSTIVNIWIQGNYITNVATQLDRFKIMFLKAGTIITYKDCRLFFYDIETRKANQTFIGGQVPLGSAAVTLTIPRDSWLTGVRIPDAVNGETYDMTVYPQLELGSIATDYEPYQGTTYDITFPTEAGTVYGGTLDVTSGLLTVDRGFATFNGSEVWTKSSIGSEGTSLGLIRLWTRVSEVVANNRITVCNQLPTRNAATWGTKSSCTCCTEIAERYEVVIDTALYADVEAWKEHIAQEPLQAMFYITPITYTITPQEITILCKENNIFADTGQTAISYYDNQTSTDPYVDYSLTSAFDASTTALDKAEEVAQDLVDLQAQIDGKIETWCQKTDPSTAWTTTELKNQHNGDLWYYTGESTSNYKNNTTYKYIASTNTWTEYSASTDLFDKIDTKASIYYGKPSAVTQNLEVGDYLVDSTDGCSYRWDGSKWVKLTDYKAAIDEIEVGGRNILLNSAINESNLSKIRATSSFSFVTEDGIECYKTTGNNTAHLFNNTGTWDCLSETLKANTTYTYSAWIKTNVTHDFSFSAFGRFNVSNSASTKSDKTHEDIVDKRIYKPETITENQWTKISITFTTNDLDESTFGVYPVYNTGTDTVLYIYGMKLEKGNKSTDWTPAPEDVDASIATAQSTADTAMDRATAIYGTCSTDSTVDAKVVICPDFVLFEGARIQVTFTNANTASAPTLNINNTGAKPIYINKTAVSDTNQLLWTAGSKMEFVYDGTGWIAQNVPYALYGTCSTSASTAAKDVTCNEAVICKGTTISVNMTNTNTAANATMNVGSTLAKDIYANGAKLTTNSRFNWRAKTTQKFVFDGQVWRMDDDSVKALATAYITEIDDDGIMVHPEDDDTSGWAISDAIQLFKNGISYIKLWIENNIPKIRIGKEDQGHIILDNDSVDVRNDDKVLASFGATSVIGDTNDWHQTITANQITFAKGNDTITYISPDKLYTINAEVADAFYISNYSIRNASDGKLVIGLRR